MRRGVDWLLLGAVIIVGWLCFRQGTRLRAAAEPAGLVEIEAGQVGVLVGPGDAEVRTLDGVSMPDASVRGAGALWFHVGVGLLGFAVAWLFLASLRRPSLSWRSRVLVFPLLGFASFAVGRMAAAGGPHAVTARKASEIDSTALPPAALALVLALAVMDRQR